MHRLGWILCLWVLSASAWAQTTPIDKEQERFQTIDGIVSSYYQSLSGQAGIRDWNGFEKLFHADARVNAISYTGMGRSQGQFGNLRAYIRNATRFIESNDFYQEEIHRSTQYFGQMALVFSTYYLQYRPSQGYWFEDRGIVSFQLVYTENRWWISSILWNTENPNNVIPEDYLPPVIRDSERLYAINEVDVSPAYEAGDYALSQKLANTSSAVSETVRSSLRGVLKLRFVVNKDGTVSDVLILQSPHPDISKKAIETLQNLSGFKPGLLYGQPVRVNYITLTVELTGISAGN